MQRARAEARRSARLRRDTVAVKVVVRGHTVDICSKKSQQNLLINWIGGQKVERR